MGAQAVLRTAWLQLVPLVEEDLEAEVELDSDPEVMQYLWKDPLLPTPRELAAGPWRGP